MTTNRDTAAWRQSHSTKSKTVTLAVLLISGLALGGCESAGSLLSNGAGDPSVTNAAAVAPQPQMQKFAVALPLGPPEASGKVLQDQLKNALAKKNISVAALPTDKSEYTLRGYVVAGADKGKSKVSYIWDVTNAAEKQVHRISGEEAVTASKGKDQWANLTPQVAELIAAKTVNSVSTWLATQAPTAPAAGTPAGSVPIAANTAVPTGTKGAPVPVATAAPLAASPTTQTGSIARGPATAMARVTGAPGDGNSSLATAIQTELQKNGLSLASTPDANTYRVEGKVAVTQGTNGKQPIVIDWTVVDPAGKKLGTVSQKNDIPQGSVDGAWGQTATAAAEAAAKGIVRLLPSPGASAATAPPPKT